MERTETLAAFLDLIDDPAVRAAACELLLRPRSSGIVLVEIEGKDGAAPERAVVVYGPDTPAPEADAEAQPRRTEIGRYEIPRLPGPGAA